jgi:hypothetical protein
MVYVNVKSIHILSFPPSKHIFCHRHRFREKLNLSMIVLKMNSASNWQQMCFKRVFDVYSGLELKTKKYIRLNFKFRVGSLYIHCVHLKNLWIINRFIITNKHGIHNLMNNWNRPEMHTSKNLWISALDPHYCVCMCHSSLNHVILKVETETECKLFVMVYGLSKAFNGSQS